MRWPLLCILAYVLRPIMMISSRIAVVAISRLYALCAMLARPGWWSMPVAVLCVIVVIHWRLVNTNGSFMLLRLRLRLLLLLLQFLLLEIVSASISKDTRRDYRPPDIFDIGNTPPAGHSFSEPAAAVVDVGVAVVFGQSLEVSGFGDAFAGPSQGRST